MTLDEAIERAADLSDDEIRELREECAADVARPGKLEEQALYVPYYYAYAMNGMQNEMWGDYWMFNVYATDRKIFPELNGVDVVVLTTDENGFVVEGSPEDVALDEARYAAHEEELNEDEECPECGDLDCEGPYCESAPDDSDEAFDRSEASR